MFQCNSLIYCVLHCAFLIFCFSVQLKKTYCVLQYAFHTMFYSVLVWFSRFFSATHSYIGFYTVHFPFSVFPCNLLTYMCYNGHFTLCSTMCRPYFLGCLVSLTHILCSLLGISNFLYGSEQHTHILCFTMCISHYVYSVPVCFSRFFSAKHSYTMFYTLRFPFSMFLSATH